MHGLINRSIQRFVCDGYGTETWEEVAARADLGLSGFESMLTYEDALTPRVLDAMAQVVGRPREELMEDLGTYLVTNPDFEAVRRLLRFGGVDFQDFLFSLDDLPDRARLAVSDLHLPGIELREHAAARFSLICEAPVVGFGHVMMGVLRVMADDYGTLALLEHTGSGQGFETLTIQLVMTDFAEGRHFELGAQVG
ncbi:heme NO-binding domain-containing protein [Sulfitobacter sp. TSTF-M16]|uniref:Heme NO-binding domain-containing protein n=1 Tax=Sulfitobacter aestuariivivens TaxID=2766981 RepID=A0A927D105_9RHOB|nr:heme NO-binding domain-containing protein [Sulfitobacter aestuariivivens]MBD3662383.1 heme NO-binding domain-containing protein [Sulfitobacter aestuariivivens]